MAKDLHFGGLTDLHRWLSLKPREVSVSIAARAALRSAPFVAIVDNDQAVLSLTAAILRGTSVSRISVRYPPTREIGTTAYAAANTAYGVASAYAATQNVAIFAARAAGNAATAAAYDADAADAATNAAADAAYAVEAAPYTANSAMWRAIALDATCIAADGETPVTLSERARTLAYFQPLWLEGTPLRAQHAWALLRNYLSGADNWDVWFQWYERRLQGRPESESVELIYASVPNEMWDEGPAAANRWIKEQLEKLPPSQASLDGAMSADAVMAASQGVFDLTLNAAQKLTPTWRAADADAGKDYGGFPVEELYADALQAFADFADYALDPSTHNYLPPPLRQSAKKLRNCLPAALADASPLVAERALAMALRAVEHVARSGELPPHDMLFLHHQGELRGMYQRLAAIWPELTKYRKGAGLDRFEEPDAKLRDIQNALLATAAADENVASPQLQATLLDTIDAIRNAEDAIPPGADEKTRKSKIYDAMKSAAAQLAPIQRWTSNAAAMVSRNSENAAKTIENLEKLGRKLSAFSDYWEWIGRWWL